MFQFHYDFNLFLNQDYLIFKIINQRSFSGSGTLKESLILNNKNHSNLLLLNNDLQKRFISSSFLGLWGKNKEVNKEKVKIFKLNSLVFYLAT